MKRFLLLFLALTLTLSALGCARGDTADDEAVADVTEQIVIETPETPKEQNEPVAEKPLQTEQKPIQNTTEPEPQKEPESTPETNTEPQKEPETVPETIPVTVPNYRAYACRSSKDIRWKQVRFTNESNVTFHLEIPSDWELIKGKGYTVMRDGKTIGTLAFKKPQSPKGFYEYSSNYVDQYQVLRSYQVNWYHQSGIDTIERVFEFHTDQGMNNIQLYICVNYGELDNSASEKLLNSALTVPKIKNIEFPDISQTNGSKKILLLGNSFFNSSRINAILSDMLIGTGYTLTSVARGYAEVLTYTSDPEICSRVESGEYAYVFLCGFYTDGNVQSTKIMLDCCNKSNTRLVMFPAHNEEQSVIDQTFNSYSGITLLDWKGELDSLIASGVDKWDLCINDTYKHSTPLAGYVGAHMIYRNMFGKVPPAMSSSSPITQAEVDRVLPGYSQSMHKPEAPEHIEFNGIEYKI